MPGRRSRPAKHAEFRRGPDRQLFGHVAKRWAGAQAFSSFDTYMAPYVRVDAMDYASVRQCIQELVYNLNVPSRWGTQTPLPTSPSTGSAPTTCVERCR